MGLSEEDTRDLNDYILNITLAKGSGEYCICEYTCIVVMFDSNIAIAHILAPGAHAHMPLVDRIHELKIPVVFVCTSLQPVDIVQPDPSMISHRRWRLRLDGS